MIFLSYRRTDGPQACRVHDWLTLRFGQDAVFMDVSAIPFAVSFPDFIGTAIAASRILIALIGRDWHTRLQELTDPVRMELETAVAAGVPILPVLIGTTPMPSPDDLPASLTPIARQNAAVIGVLHDFDTHMRALLPKIESMLGGPAAGSIVTREPRAVEIVCSGTMFFLERSVNADRYLRWSVFGTVDFLREMESAVSLYLHRISRLGDVLELHFLLSFWTRTAHSAHQLAGLVMQRIEQEPIVPPAFLRETEVPLQVKLRPSDEDPRQVWKMVTDTPLQLSLAYVATVSIGVTANDTAPDSRAQPPEIPGA
jgi:uncharacterized protein DUF4255/TIR domain-containing protein